jgi:hypothetical protein
VYGRLQTPEPRFTPRSGFGVPCPIGRSSSSHAFLSIAIAIFILLVVTAGQSFAAERFAFWNYDGNIGKVWVANEDGTGLSALAATQNFDVALSPDASTLVFVRGDEIVSVGVGGGAEQVLFKGPQDDNPPNGRGDRVGGPAFSPDGQKIIFSYFPVEYPGCCITNGDLWEVNADGTGAHMITAGCGDERSPRFSPDGTRIVFSATCSGSTRVRTASADGQNQVVLGVGAYPAFSPDGSRIAYLCPGPVSGSGGVCLMNQDGSSNMVYAGGTPADQAFHPSAVDWSPDRTKLLVTADYDPEPPSSEYGSWVYTLPATSPVPLTFAANATRLRRGYYARFRQPAQDYTSAFRTALLKYAPVLIYDSQERYFADSAREITDNYVPLGDLSTTNRLATADGRTLAAANPELGFPTLSLSFLNTTYPSGDVALLSDYVDEVDTYEADAQRMHAVATYADRSYGRAVRDSQGHYWLQYWFFYYYNPQNAGIINTGVHEGDWEMIQIGLDGDLNPDVLTYARHHDEQSSCLWNQVPKAFVVDHDVPVVYIANGSHASYFNADHHARGALGLLPTDEADGLGYSVQPSVELIAPPPAAPWSWPGHWGGTAPGSLGGNIGEAASPQGPAFHDAWSDPKSFDDDAKACDSGLGGASAGADLSSQAPPAPTVRTNQVADGVDVNFAFDSLPTDEREPVSVLLTVHPADASLLPSSKSVSVTADHGAAHLALPVGSGPYSVRASAFTKDGLRSAVTTANVG